MIPAVILSGGASSRMGGHPKALLPTGRGDETFLGRIAATLVAGGASDIVVVTGYHDEAISELVASLPTPVRLVRNRTPEAGQLSSLLVPAARESAHPLSSPASSRSRILWPHQ